MFNKDTVYVIGDAQVSPNNPISKQFSQFFLGLVIDSTNGKIIDAECSATIGLTIRFIQSLFVGRRVDDESLLLEVQSRYFGSSQKALMAALKDAQKKYSHIIAALPGQPGRNPART
ncbi:DUF3870 domain-containing protein [Metabacillus sp. GX 13764]|uniref:DUF3870 domain-containing protein n=1 Tax=Metabacillus kandeliae TaxID=2900151 RepID=UPI001E4F2B70|nr:DUF3870 domain-containing protein [Metabacillus kandeliae]MCD7035066.1 DUF3870 domain-containing protein [Metabacillus kandeliae]